MAVLKIPIPHNAKEKNVKSLSEAIKNAKTLMVVSIQGLPSKQFQDIKKTIRKYADIRVAKKNILLRTLKEFGKESILPLEKEIKENSAFATSDLEGFELAGIFNKNKTSMFAKAGQIAPDDIEVKDGPTNLVPGPAISELGALGIQIAVEDGKIAIKQPKVVVKKDGVISGEVASLLQKLDIQPMTIGLEPVAVYDIESEKIFINIKIDSEEAASSLSSAAGKALGFAQKIVYACKETIGYLLAKANAEGEALGKLQPAEEKTEEKVDEKPTEAPTEAPAEEKKEEEATNEEKAPSGVPSVEGKEENDTQLNNPEEKA